MGSPFALAPAAGVLPVVCCVAANPPGFRFVPCRTPLVPAVFAYRRDEHDESLQPGARRAAQLGPPSAASLPVQALIEPAAPMPVQVEVRARASFEDLLPALVRKVAWSGDSRRGSIRLELGAGALAGATLLVQADDGRVCVRLSAPPGVDLDGWRERIAGRLAARGLGSVDDVHVRG
jgi:hypothetical protein